MRGPSSIEEEARLILRKAVGQETEPEEGLESEPLGCAFTYAVE